MEDAYTDKSKCMHFRVSRSTQRNSTFRADEIIILEVLTNTLE